MLPIEYTKQQAFEVADILQKGRIVAFPTDTVYGLGVLFNDERALSNLKSVKKRDANKPIPIMVDTIASMERLAYVSSFAKTIINHFSPGPITYILPKKESVKSSMNNGKDTVAIRIPKDEFLLKVMEICKSPLLVTSANIANHPAAMTDQEVKDQLHDTIDGIVLGEAEGKMASTIIDLTVDQVHIVRQGPITKEAIIELLYKEGLL